jgi:glyceraldehyde-3-phosphate dehydrogenase (NADP+)
MSFYDEVKAGDAYKYYVNGQWLESKSGKTQAIINPSTNQPVYHVQGEPAGP